MTLTTLLPSLRRSIPDPLDPAKWPEDTRATTTDLIVSGLSLLRVVELSGTPCSIGGCSVLPGLPRTVSSSHHTVITVVRVRAVTPIGGAHARIRVDLRDEDPTLLWAEARLIGRASTAHARSIAVSTHRDYTVSLPGDIVPGDLLAVPAAPTANSVVDHVLRITERVDPDRHG